MRFRENAIGVGTGEAAIDCRRSHLALKKELEFYMENGVAAADCPD
jgi:hypothetical protein